MDALVEPATFAGKRCNGHDTPASVAVTPTASSGCSPTRTSKGSNAKCEPSEYTTVEATIWPSGTLSALASYGLCIRPVLGGLGERSCALTFLSVNGMAICS